MNMKYLVLSAFMLFSVLVSAQTEKTALSWLTNFNEARALAKEKKKPILLYFTGSDWCAPCKMLKKDFFDSDEFKGMADEMILVMIDYPRNTELITPEQLAYNKTVIADYNREGVFPKVLAFSAGGKKLGDIAGYSRLRDPGNHFKFVERYLRSE